MARPSPSCAHDDDRLHFSPASPPSSNSSEKKESTGPRLSQLCPPCATPSSSSSLDYRRSDAHIVENGFAERRVVSKSAKVVLVSSLTRDRQPLHVVPTTAGVTAMNTPIYDKSITSLLVVDPYNDFISEGGKLWPLIKAVAEANDCVSNMLKVLNAARAAKLRVFYAMHHRYRAGDYETWR